MGLFAFPYTSVLDVSANSILGNNTASPSTAIALTATQVRSLISVYTTTEVDTLLSGKANTSHTHAASDITSGTIDTARLGSGTADATTYLRGDQTWATVTAGVGGSTGSADNAVLRADGTGGATLQSSAFIIPDNYTASPNNTVNHASIQATGDTTNVSVSIVPKGTGALSLHVPDGTSTGGNARGARAVDLQTDRIAETQVASGASSFIAGSERCTVSQVRGAAIASFSSAVGGNGNTSAIIATNSCTVTGLWSVVAGSTECTNSGALCAIIASAQCTAGTENTQLVFGYRTAAYPQAQSFTHGAGRHSATGDARAFQMTGLCKTTTNSEVEIVLGSGAGNSLQYIIVPAGRQISGTLLIQGIKSDGSVSARYARHFTIRRVGNTTTLDDSQTIGTDLVNGTSLSLTADDTNDRLKIGVTGVSGETWRWNCRADCIDQAYGS